MRDPYFQKILDGLAGELDPREFEDCMGRLLLSLYPSLVPIRGGSDAGMDFAAKSSKGKDFPLLVTTAEDVERNLKESLESFVRHGLSASLVGLVTSLDLTPPRRRELRKQAKSLGFRLLETNLHHRWSLANRFYRNSELAKEYLGVTGKPSALSALPKSGHLLADLELLARSEDLEWLRTTPGDLVLVGQPGSGKTALLLELVREGRALFLASKDESEIANTYRDLQPELILVDDAHADLELLARLRGIRGEIQASFRIIASTWPGAKEEVVQALGGVASCKARELELLTRAEILEILRALGVNEPDDDPYLRLLVDQAANKPGLAVVLGKLWLQGEWREVLTGQAVRKELIPKLNSLLGRDPTEILACFALGGDAGMPMEAVGVFLREGRGDLRQKTVMASQGGVLFDLREGVLRVEPEILRSALLGEVFFGASPLPYHELLPHAADKAAAVETLSSAALRGVAVPLQDLEPLLLETVRKAAWQAYAASGPRAATWVLERFPRAITEVAEVLLQTLPGPTIRRLLDDAKGDSRPLHATILHPLRILQEWVQGILYPGNLDASISESSRRRRQLVDEITLSASVSGISVEGLRACLFALCPTLESFRGDAALHGVVLRRRPLPSRLVEELLALWGEIKSRFDDFPPEAWPDLQEVLNEATYAPGFEDELEDTDLAKRRELSKRIVLDLVDSARSSPGFASVLAPWIEKLDLGLQLEIPEAYSVLFPEMVAGPDICDAWERRKERARQLAESWGVRTPLEVAHEVNKAREEAERWHYRGLGEVPTFFAHLAAAVPMPEEWLETFLENGKNDVAIRALLRQVVKERRSRWESALERCLHEPGVAWAAADLALQVPELPDNLFEVACRSLIPEQLMASCQAGHVTVDLLRQLLAHPDEEVRVATAIGEWLCEPRGRVPADLAAAWRQAILNVKAVDPDSKVTRGALGHWLAEILQADAALALDWLLAQLHTLSDEVIWFPQGGGLFSTAIKALNEEGQARAVAAMKACPITSSLLRSFQHMSPAVYQTLLAREDLRMGHLSPLIGKFPDAAWSELAVLAIEHGYPPAGVATAAIYLSELHPLASRGLGEEHWSRWKKGFEDLLSSDDPRLREVAQHGVAITDENIRAAAKERRRYELKGRL